MYILGVFNAHNSGVTLLKDSQIIYASAEERFTREKFTRSAKGVFTVIIRAAIWTHTLHRLCGSQFFFVTRREPPPLAVPPPHSRLLG